MSLMTAAMKAELQTVAPRVAPVLEISGVGAALTTLRLCGVSSPIVLSSAGRYDPRITSFGKYRRSLPDVNGGLQGRTAQITVDDTDGVAGPYMFQIRQKVATVRLVSSSPTSPLTTADYFTLFVGVVSEVQQRGSSWVLTLSQDDKALVSSVPKATINAKDWPNAHSSALGQPVPIVYGKHDMGTIKPGMVPTLYVDTVNFKFVPCGHALLNLSRVWLKTASTDWTLKTVAVDYTFAYQIVGGQKYAVITWIGSPGTDPQVTCDMQGIETVGDGTGTLIENPATALKHFLSNFVFGEWRQGTWLADSTRLSSAYFTTATTWFGAFGSTYQLASRFIGLSQRSGLSELNEWCHTFELDAFWTADGKLGILPFDHRIQNAAVYPTNRVRAATDVIRGEIAPLYSSEGWTPRVTTRHVCEYSGRSENFKAITETADTGSASSQLLQKDARWLQSINGDLGEAYGARDAASRRINRYRSPLPGLRATLHLWTLDWELLTDVGVTWERGPNEDGTVGWGDETWRRRMYRALAHETDLDTMENTVDFLDVTPALTSLWALWQTLRGLSGTKEDGTVWLSLGTLLTTTRGSKKYLDDPGGLIVELANDTNPIEAASGLTVERTGTNDVTRSSFASGTTGLTLTGTGVNGSAIAVDATNLRWETALSPNSLKFTAGSPHAADLIAQFPDTAAYAGSSIVTFSMDASILDNAQPAWRLQRLVDSLYWNDLTNSWGAVADNAWASPVGTRVASHTINVGAGATALRLFVLLPTGGTASRVAHLYHVQLEVQRWPSSRMLADGATFTRSADTVTVANDNGSSEVLPLTLGTVEMVITPLWGAGNLAAATQFYLLSLEYDANNKWEVLYDKDTASILFRVTAAGVAYTATVPTAFGALGNSYKITARWTSGVELGLATKTASVFFESTKGTDVTYVTPTKTAGKSLYIGCKTGTPATNQLNGSIRWIRFSPFAKSDGLIGATVAL